MSGVGDVDDIPDSLVGRFIDRLDHQQHRLIKANTDGLSNVRGVVIGHEQIHLELLYLIDDLDNRVQSLSTSFRQICARPPIADASHRGPGTVARQRSVIEEFDDFLLDLERPPSSLTMRPASATEYFDIANAPPASVTLSAVDGANATDQTLAVLNNQTINQLMEQTQRLDLQQHDVHTQIEKYNDKGSAGQGPLSSALGPVHRGCQCHGECPRHLGGQGHGQHRGHRSQNLHQK